MKMGAGVMGYEAQQVAHAHGQLMVTGNCPTVSIAGGYTQGGGHGPLVSKFGLAADQVLEWEVVTSTGELLTASPIHNADLYWALSGGGGGTYGVVLSLTAKVYPELPTAAANLTFSGQGLPQETFHDVLQTFMRNLPRIVDTGAVVEWSLYGTDFAMTPATAPGLTKVELNTLFRPVLAELDRNHVNYSMCNRICVLWMFVV